MASITCSTCRDAAAALLVSLFALAVSPAHAITFQDLYRPTVMPEPGAPSTRAAAEQAAMGQLLERVTGNRGAALEPDLQSMIADAARYVSSYATLDGGRVQVGFLSSAVNSELQSRGRRIWGPERPLTLIWLAIDSGRGERTLLGAGASDTALSPEMAALTDEIRMQLADVASERGLPIALPLLDLQDLSAVSFIDVWGGYDDRIEQASQRYAADAILVGRLLVGDVGPTVQWTLLRGGGRAVSASQDVAEGLQWTADQYAQEFGVVGGVRTLRVIVQDVESLEDYGRVMSYLDGLSSLQSIDVDGVDGDVMTLRVAARGDAGVIERMFSLGRVLEPADPAPGFSQTGDSNSLVFKVARSAPRQ
ncbi:MAG TPA: DUF2066 domain-containing protein [Gammaproteobacteria bacterium]|nr:DUF2066 domain-containing protein [Gammaproteobacteria bacterium]